MNMATNMSTPGQQQELFPAAFEPASTGLLLLKRILLSLPLISPITLTTTTTTTSSPAYEPPQTTNPQPPSIQWTSLPSPSPSLTSDDEHLLLARHKSTLKITLNRPSKGNALTTPMIESITTLFRNHINPDPSIHRVIITGRGNYFCTGMDLGLSCSSGTTRQAIGEGEGEEEEEEDDQLFSPAAVHKRARLLAQFLHTIDTSPKQTIALLNGPAFGGGVGLLTVCDIRLASSSSTPSSSSATKFFCSLSEVRLGLCPATIHPYIVREWGPSLARMAMISGRRIDAGTLLRVGVLHGLLHTEEGGEDKEGDGLERAFFQEWVLPDLRYAAPEAVGMCKRLVRSVCAAKGNGDEHDCSSDDDGIENSVGVKAFEEMLLGGGGGGGEAKGKKMTEARIGVEFFRKGIKGVVWEDMDPDHNSLDKNEAAEL